MHCRKVRISVAAFVISASLLVSTALALNGEQAKRKAEALEAIRSGGGFPEWIRLHAGKTSQLGNCGYPATKKDADAGSFVSPEISFDDALVENLVDGQVALYSEVEQLSEGLNRACTGNAPLSAAIVKKIKKWKFSLKVNKEPKDQWADPNPHFKIIGDTLVIETNAFDQNVAGNAEKFATTKISL